MSWRGIVESPIFSKLVGDYFSDDEYARLQLQLIRHPEVGDLIPNSGGVRKLRWAARSKGKRGGVRIIYYVRDRSFIWLLTVYAKSEESNIPGHVLKKIKEAMGNE